MRAHLAIQRKAVALACVALLAGCAGPEGIRAPFEADVPMVDGPAIQDIVTPFDRALSCLDGRLGKSLTFSVGAIVDSTGKEQLSDGGVGKFVTQGAGDIVQSALFQAGTTVLNRRDPRIMETETRWGLHTTKNVIPSMFFITGSINSLDFIPGGGFEAQVAGVGPRYRQHRILIGLDLSMTDTKTGRIVANVPLQKQVVASEIGFGIGRFFGDTLVSLDVGKQNREAVHFAMRQMLNLATFELLTQVMKPEAYVDCRLEVQSVHGVIGNTKVSRRMSQFLAEREDLEAGVVSTPSAALAKSAPVGGGLGQKGTQPAPRADKALRATRPGAAPGNPLVSSASTGPATPVASPTQPVNSALVEGIASDLNPLVEAAPDGAAVPAPPHAPVAGTSGTKASATTPRPAAAQGEAAAQRRYFSDEQVGPSANAVRALDLPVRSRPEAEAGGVLNGAADAVADDAGVQPVNRGAEPAPAADAGPAPAAVTSAAPEPVQAGSRPHAATSTNAVVAPLSGGAAPVPASAAASAPVSVVAAAVAPPVLAAVGSAAVPTYQDRLLTVDTCTMPVGRHEPVQAPKASKPGTMFFATGPVGTTLCVADADGKLWSHRFEKGKGRSFHGTPPFSLRSRYLPELDIYFQGWKVAPVADGVDRIRLVERALD